MIYRKIIENIEYFINEQKLNQEENKEEEKIIKKVYNYDDNNENFFQKATSAGQSTYNEPSNLNINYNMTKTSLINKPIIMTTTSVNFQKAREKFFYLGSKPKMRIFDDKYKTFAW